jgi:thiamine-phosphate pyrophosphorylase
MSIPFEVPRFYPILDTSVLAARGCAPFAVAKILVDVGVRILQFRHKGAWTQAEYDEAARVRTVCHDAGVLFVINDRADYAKLLGAALHIGQDDLPPVAARKIIGDEVMGLSTHNKRQLSFGNDEAVEYLSLGPIFNTTSKQNPDPVVGLEGLKTLRPLTEKPLVAIGGITLENAPEIFEAGANAVAVISGFLPEKYSKGALQKRAAEWLEITAVTTHL